jgi:hypothetical protein
MVLGISQDFASSHDGVQEHTALSEFPSHICLPGGGPDGIRLVLKLMTKITREAGQDPNPPSPPHSFVTPTFACPLPATCSPLRSLISRTPITLGT